MRYFFHLVSDYQTIRDEIGIDLDDVNRLLTERGKHLMKLLVNFQGIVTHGWVGN